MTGRKLFPIFAWAMTVGLFFAECAFSGSLVQFRIIGYPPDIQLKAELLNEEKPVTVANFMRLIDSGSFSNMFFHRLIPDFIMQGGGFRVNAAGNAIEAVPHFGTITNEFDVGLLYSNVRGTIAMAKVAGDPDSATSHFFINLNDNIFLDTTNGGFTVFARVLSDANSMIAFWNSLSHGVYLVNAGVGFPDLPVNYVGTAPPAHYNQLIYCDVSLMQVSVSNGPSGHTISWNSAAGLTNIVEYTEQFSPPLWQALMETNGTGSRLSATDTNISAARFYRVRVQ